VTATPSEHVDWGALTEVEEKTLEKVVFSMDGGSTDRMEIDIKCVSPGPNGWKIDSFGDELIEPFTKYVLPPDVREETKEVRWLQEATERAAPNEDFESDGVVSEFLLYLFTEAYLDAPIASHRLYWLDSRGQEKKGSDGIFVGRHQGEECLYVGEAKFPNSISAAIGDAFESISEFHTRGTNERMRRELDIANQNLASERSSLSPSEIEAIASRLEPNAHEEFKIVHPIFVGHQTKKLSWYPNPGSELKYGQDTPPAEQQIRHKLEESLGKIDYVQKQQEKQPELSPAVGTAELVFFPFPVPNTKQFKKEFFGLLFKHWDV
jgi:hypothetical protein